MRRSPFAFGLVLSIVLACGTEPPEPGTLTLQVDPPPALVATIDLTIQGTVTRVPEIPDLPLVVTVTTSTATLVDTAAAGGGFAVPVTLLPDASTAITVTAADGSGSAVTPVTLSVTHDGTPPAIAQWAPLDGADLVATTAAIQIRFTERIRPGTAEVSVRESGTGVPGQAQLSADSLTLTFVPAMPLGFNAVYEVSVVRARDVAGNSVDSSAACFVTGGALAELADPMNDYLVSSPPPEPRFVPADVLAVRFWWYTPATLDTATVRLVVRHTVPRSFEELSSVNTFLVIDLDIDQDSTTGVPAFKDIALSSFLPSSGLGADYAIFVTPGDDGSVNAGTLIWTAVLEGELIRNFTPQLCGPAMGFSIPRSAIGAPGGPVDLVVYSQTANNRAYFADAAPDSGSFTLPLLMASASRSSRPTGIPLDRRTQRLLRDTQVRSGTGGKVRQ